jgi:signal transduction histidine kinase
MRAHTSAAMARHRRLSLRSSLAGRLLVGALSFTILLTAGVGGFLLISRSEQTSSGALSNADNRAGVAGQLIARVTEPQAQYAASDLASLNSFQAALSSSDPGTRVANEFSGRRIVAVAGVDIVVLNATGAVLYTTECDDAAGPGGPTHPPTSQCEGSNPHVTSSLASVAEALAILHDPSCKASADRPQAARPSACPPGVEGVEDLAAEVPAFDVAVPVFDHAHRNASIGVVVYSSPLQTLFENYGPVIGYTPLYLELGGRPSMLRFTGSAYTPLPATPPEPVLTQAASHLIDANHAKSIAHAIYAVPGEGEVAGSFVPLQAPGSTRVAGFIGVEVPLSLFSARAAQDEQTIAQISLTAMLVLCVLVLFFVDRFVRRPVNRLERGVARIAAGDYTTDIPVASHDELGRLASSVNRMREQIAGYIRHIDGSMDRLQRVSRALTTTTGGVDVLQDAVLDSAAAIVGRGASATLLSRNGDHLMPVRTLKQTATLGPAGVASLLAGRHVRMQAEGSHVVAVPILYQDHVTGAVAVSCAAPISDSDERALMTLANNAAIALENTRLFEQQKETVVRLRELNDLKSNFLATTQHELRTPVLAIQGQLDLLKAAWSRWDDAAKMEVLRDIEIATALLGELVATILDFSLLNAETVELHPTSVDVRQAVDAAVADVSGHFKDGLPVALQVDVADGLAVRADAARFRQVVRSLVDNAVKFTPPGGRVSVRAHRDLTTDRCRIEVADNGIGISSEALGLVFDRFYQEDNSRTRKYGGMGMGLPLVRKLCEAHGAVIRAESEPGTGSRFIMLWPLGEEVAEPQTPQPAGFRFFSSG